MILTAHLLSGAAIVAKTQNPFLGFLFAFLSHYFLDLLPHQEYSIENIRKLQGHPLKSQKTFPFFFLSKDTIKLWKESFFDFLKVALDFSLGVLIIFILSENLLLSLSGGFFAVLPDGLTFLSIILPKNKLLKKHYFFHREKVHYLGNKKIPSLWKILTQVFVIFTAIFLLL